MLDITLFIPDYDEPKTRQELDAEYQAWLAGLEVQEESPEEEYEPLPF